MTLNLIKTNREILLRFVPFLILCLIIIAITIKSFLDFRIYYSSDEIQSYFVKGFTQTKFSQYSMVSGGLYIDIYYLLSKFFSGLQTIFLVRLLTSIFFVISMYISVKILAGKGIALTSLVLVSSMPFTYTRPGHHLIATGCAILAITAILKLQIPNSFNVVIPLLTIASSVRAEFFLATIIFIIINIIVVIHQSDKWKLKVELLKNTFFCIIFPLYIITHYTYPLSFHTSRSYEAFGAYYNTRTAFDGEDPYSDFDRIIRRSFGESQNISQAFDYAPTNVLTHILLNFIDIPKFLLLNTLQIPENSFLASTQFFSLMTTLSFVTIYYFTLRKFIKLRYLYRFISDQPKIKILLIFILLVPNLISMLLIYTVYMHTIFALGILLALYFLKVHTPKYSKFFIISICFYILSLVELSSELINIEVDSEVYKIYKLNSNTNDFLRYQMPLDTLLPAQKILYSESRY